MSAITLIFPPDTRFPPVNGQWRRLHDGCIAARYTREQLQRALEVADAITATVKQQALV